MYRHILVPTDGSALSEMAIEHGVALAKATNAKVTALTVSAPFNGLSLAPGIVLDREQYKEKTADLAAKHLFAAKDAAAAANVTCDLLHVEHDHPYRAIIDTAKEKGCDVIVMASHGRRGVAALVLGSETHKVLTHSSIPVLVFRGQRPSAFFVAS
jgi:nucleotide-binding universal stress UspA family protein